MWKLVNGKMIQTTDETRIKFRTNISQEILEQLEEISEEHDTYSNYLLENGLWNVLAAGVIEYDKNLRPTDRIQYKTTYDKELLESVKQLAKDHKLFINDVIEYSVGHIDMKHIKTKDHKNRLES
ncbi:MULTISPECIES: rRNA methyltransferase [unclassified Sporosarcina]|uniref:rRNA methyltransferase n=1 Tax=unclassified Sporosarcina TaxID=2647733 RepID=UPI000C1727B0|nr:MULTISPECIES: rRNA methyltransferase [unclassified Sporosarcina]PIC99504.1 rRNA methyltransferase [Sporosarcina sp. P29]PID06515.1 rRNA methyltransferase [Sporosarcina sp. P30]PID09709.1 rRNA methyltransferase [Sporosarcina sp. P31]PID13287.1 rRNA methyltransferase [Sporosarcina sp. P32b]